MKHPFDLTGKTAIVVGGAGGLGQQQAIGLANAGAVVAVVDVNAERLASAIREIKQQGGNARPFLTDITDPHAVQAMVHTVVAEFGRIDILVNAAGITQRCPSEDFPEELFERILNINLNGLFYACQSVGKVMIRQGGGRIINVASIFATVGLPESVAYSMSKGAVVQITRTLAVEWATSHIAVNGLMPSWFETPMGKVADNRNQFYKGVARVPSAEELKEKTIGRVPLGRYGMPHEIIGATVFLASDAASMVTGHLLAVDGGFLAQ
ncbi:SDR family NAD(P)-dependent oxidoreductase [Paenibacillus koleovorans]|uniref:SDR family NAD(P)-dependent oxidoreductase n=1 Tax=Paenibacillus koleovorans TaxID=121608 RepID=UPI000FDBD22E|nr:SDR family oxidoreductase [Paenibacillus koleovorans]